MKTEGIKNVVKKPTDLKWPQLCTTCDLKSHDDALTLLDTQEAISHSSHIRAEGGFFYGRATASFLQAHGHHGAS